MARKRKISARQAKCRLPNAAKAVKRESPVQFSVSMICTLVAALFIPTFNVQAFEIPTGSMEPTLLVGDHLLVDRSDVEPKAQSSPLLPRHPSSKGTFLSSCRRLNRTFIL
jgi:signal peptidase I